MNIDYTVTALMFPAIPLLMGVYSNRFHSLSILVRQLHDEHVYEKHIPPEWKKQFINLSGRITLLRWTILFAAFGFLFNMLNKKPNAANNIVHLKRVILPLRLMNCFFHSGGICFS